MKRQERDPTNLQLYGENKRRYDILATYDNHWFAYRALDLKNSSTAVGISLLYTQGIRLLYNNSTGER